MKKKMKSIITFITVGIIAVNTVGFSVGAAETDLLSVEKFENYYDNTTQATGSEIFGDVDFDGQLKVKDATAIQKYVANSVTFNNNQKSLADVDGDDTVTVRDASSIQKAVAKVIGGVPISRLYNWDFSRKSISVSILKSGQAKVKFKVSAPGYYEFKASGVEGNTNFSITLPSEKGGYTGHNRLFVYLTAGIYEINIINRSATAVNSVINYTYSKEFSLFDETKAINMFAKPITVNPNGKNVLLKINGADFTDSVKLETIGDDPKITSIHLYDSTMSLVRECTALVDNVGNATGNIPAYNYMSDYYYVYITYGDGGSDFKLSCSSMSSRLIADADEVAFDTATKIRGEYLVEGSGSDVVDYSLLSASYKFTPSKTGYYKIYAVGNSFGELRYSIYSAEELKLGMDNPIYSKQYESDLENIKLTDVEELKVSQDYYIVFTGKVFGNGRVNFKVVNSSAQEYDTYHSGDVALDKNSIAKYSKEIKVGDTVMVETAFEDDTKWFKFTATENMKVVVYSEKSYDAYLTVLDRNFNEIARIDDISLFESLDFAGIANVKAGDIYYLGASSYEASGDFYSMSLVKESLYNPMS